MKRMWIGVGLLAAVLIVGILTAEWMGKFHDTIRRDIEKAAAEAVDEKWGTATALADRAKGIWRKKRPVISALADHGPLENIDSLFRQLEIYAAARESTGFCIVCAELAGLMEALGESHRCTASNLF